MTEAPAAPEPAPAAEGAPAPNVTGPAPLRLGFARGVAPAKWERRWRAARTGQRLELVPLDLGFGDAPEAGAAGAADTAALAASCDVLILRTAADGAPAGAPGDGGAPAPARRALRLYGEALGLVVAKDHELAAADSVAPDDLAYVTLLDHPDHAPGWPAAQPWADPAWMPAGPRAALELVATGAGAILLPLPLARHLSRKREHVVLPLRADGAGDAEGAAPPIAAVVWATWAAERDADDVQRLAGVLRGRTARSSRSGGSGAGADPDPRAEIRARRAARAAEAEQQRAKRARQAAKLKPNSRGAQLAAAKAKAERKQAEKRAEQRRKRR